MVRFLSHRKLRASFVTDMRGTGADYCDLQVYVGQSVGTALVKQASDRCIIDPAGASHEQGH